MSDPATPVVESTLSVEEKEKELFFAQLKTKFGPQAPTAELLSQWKSQCGRVRWIELNPEEIYFFRPYKSAEYKGWLQSLQSVAETNAAQADELLKERIVCSCVLFPKIKQEETGAYFAGTIDTLFSQIQLASNFIPLEQAMIMVREW
jgi:hypothetical protein